MLAALAQALVHSLWQGFAIGALCAVALSTVPNRPAIRHHIASAGLFAQLVAFALTLGQGLGTPVSSPLAVAGSRVILSATPAAWPQWLVLCWATGVVLMASRLALGIRHSHTLRQTARELPTEVLAVLSELAQRLGLPPVRAALSDAVAGPQVVGIVSPILLVPTATLVGLTPRQLKAVLAHELAHLARRDPLTQAAQEAITMLLFHHPITHWLSRTARRSREQACDDVAAELVGKKAIASALYELEAYRTHALALGASTELTSRIERLVRPPTRTQPRAAGALAAAAVVMMVAAPALASDRAAQREFRRMETRTARYLELTIQTQPVDAEQPLTREQRRELDDQLRDALIAKTDALEDIEQAAIRVVEQDSPVWSTAALTQLGTCYEDMAVALMQSTVPPYLNEDQVEVYQMAIEDKAYPLYEKAEEAYEKASQMPEGAEWSEQARERLASLASTRQSLAFHYTEPDPYDPEVFQPLLQTYTEQLPAYRDRCGMEETAIFEMMREQMVHALEQADHQLLTDFQFSTPGFIEATSQQASCPDE